MGSEWSDLTWQDYQALLWHWNRHHDPDSGLPEPDYDRIRKMMVH